MKRKLLSILLTLCLAFSLLPTAALAAEGEDVASGNVAKIGNIEYATLAEAVAAVHKKTSDERSQTYTIELLRNATGSGFGVGYDKIKNGTTEGNNPVHINIEMNGHTYTVSKPTVGSSGTETNGLQLLKGSTVTLKNGTLNSVTGEDSLKNGGILIQNYCNLTLENVTLDTSANSNISYVISNNFGSLTAKGNTVIKAADGKVAFDLWYGMNDKGLYDDGVSVTFGTDFTGSVTGKIEYGAANRASTMQWPEKTKLTIENGKFEVTFVDSNAKDGVALADANISITGGTFSSDVSAYVADGYILNNGTVEKLGETNAVAKVGDTYYKTLAEAVAAAKADEATTITLLKDVELPSYIYIKDKKNITLDLNGKNITRTGNGVFYVGNAKLRVTGTGTIFENQRDGFAPIIAKGSPNDVADYTTITIDENVTLKGDYAGIFVDTDTAGKNSYHNYGLVINMKGSIDLTAIDGGVSAYGVYVQGLNKITSGNVMQINLDGVTINTGDEAIYAAGYAKWNVKNCTFNAENAAIEVRAGGMTIDGGVYTAMASEFKCEANGNGSTTQGAALAIMQHTTKLPISVYVKNGVFHSAAAVAEKNIQKNDPKPNVDLQIADGQFNGVVVADDVLNFISGGYYTSDPSAYKAEGKFVVASDKAGYSYMISGTAPTKAEVIVNDKTAVTVPTNENLTKADKTAIQTKTNIDGVAEAVAGSKDAIVKKAGVDASKVDATELIEVEVAVDVAVSDVQKNEEAAVSSITFTAKPTATVKVNGSSAGETVDVTNAMLNGKPITVKLPLPAGFELKQIIHKSAGYADEYILQEGNAQGLRSFKIVEEDGVKIAVFTVSHFSDFELSGKVTYVAPSYSGSSSSYDPTYSVSTPSKTEHGTVTVSPKSASKGDTVTVTVKPDSGYVLETLTVTDKNGNELTLKDKGNGKYTFTMPAGKVEVKATFMEDNSMLNFFYDVPNNAYFYEAVKWAVKNGITTGVGNNLFAPEQPCTRAQIVTFLWRAAGSPEPKGAASGMTDVVSGSYYEKAVAWAIENGITTGTTTSTFSPDATCTRAQAVTFLARALKAKAASAAEFSDVPTDSYFADAVAWAAANGVTEGIGGGLFGSDNDCTRGQIVTFLYRAYNK